MDNVSKEIEKSKKKFKRKCLELIDISKDEKMPGDWTWLRKVTVRLNLSLEKHCKSKCKDKM